MPMSLIPIGIVVVAVLVIIGTGYVKAPPDMAYIISGAHKKPRILIGAAGVKVPFFERLDKLYLGAIQIDVKTASSVPTAEYINVKVDSTVSVRVSQDKNLMAVAAQNFLNVDRATIAGKVNDLLEGNIREIVGTMRLQDMVQDRKLFSEKVQENAVPDLERFGLELVSFNVQNFIDDNDVINNLGIDNVAQISKNAAIAKSNAEKEVQIAQANNQKEANDAQVQAAEEIAVRQNDLAIKKAQLQKEADTQAAQAEAAKAIEAENQRKLRDVASTEANIATAQKEAELKQKQIELREYELDALVRKQADADKYKAEKDAEAELITRQKAAEAARYEQERAAEAKLVQAEKDAQAAKARADAAKYAALAEAEAIAAKGNAEAEAIRQKGLAEAEATEKKAEAYQKMGEASVLEIIMKALPEMTAAAAAPLGNVDSITIYGDNGADKIVRDVTNVTNQVMKGLAANGIDLKSIIQSAFNKTRDNVIVTPPPTED